MSDVKTRRPIRVHAGLDVYDLPPDTLARSPDDHGIARPLSMFEGRPHIEVEIAGQSRIVHVESTALAADRLWAVTCRGPSTVPLAHEPRTTVRGRDTLVWAAAYALARRDDYQASYSACDGTPSERHAFAKEHTDACAPRHIALADDAVLALEASR